MPLTNPPIATVLDEYPLSPLQQGMLFNQFASANRGIDVTQIVGTLDEVLHLEEFQRAWQHVIDHHPAMRTAFDWSGPEPSQRVYAQAPMPFEQMDWRALPQGQQQSRLEALLSADRIRGFDMAQVPLMRVTVVQLGTGRNYLMATHHHAILDGGCFKPLLTQVFDVYEALVAGRAWNLPSRLPTAITFDICVRTGPILARRRPIGEGNSRA